MKKFVICSQCQIQKVYVANYYEGAELEEICELCEINGEDYESENGSEEDLHNPEAS